MIYTCAHAVSHHDDRESCTDDTGSVTKIVWPCCELSSTQPSWSSTWTHWTGVSFFDKGEARNIPTGGTMVGTEGRPWSWALNYRSSLQMRHDSFVRLILLGMPAQPQTLSLSKSIFILHANPRWMHLFLYCTFSAQSMFTRIITPLCRQGFEVPKQAQLHAAITWPLNTRFAKTKVLERPVLRYPMEFLGWLLMFTFWLSRPTD